MLPGRTPHVRFSDTLSSQVLVAEQELLEVIDEDLEFLILKIGTYHDSLRVFPRDVRIRQCITNIYALVLSYILRLYCFLRRPRPTRFVKAVFFPFRTKLSKLQSQINKQEMVLTTARSLASEQRE